MMAKATKIQKRTKPLPLPDGQKTIITNRMGTETHQLKGIYHEHLSVHEGTHTHTHNLVWHTFKVLA